MDRIAKLKEYLQDTPGDSFLKHALALEYVKLNKDDLAEPLFEEILKDDPDYIGSYYHLGKLLERKNNLEAAQRVYERGMQAANDRQDVHAYQELKSAADELGS